MEWHRESLPRLPPKEGQSGVKPWIASSGTEGILLVGFLERDATIHSQCLEVASGVTAPSPALEGAPRFRPKVVLMSLSLVKWKC
jgi:hypothetical protein